MILVYSSEYIISFLRKKSKCSFKTTKFHRITSVIFSKFRASEKEGKRIREYFFRDVKESCLSSKNKRENTEHVCEKKR